MLFIIKIIFQVDFIDFMIYYNFIVNKYFKNEIFRCALIFKRKKIISQHKNKKKMSIRSLTYMNTSKYANNIRLMDHKSTFYLLIYSVMILI